LIRVWIFVILIPALRLLQIQWETVETVSSWPDFPLTPGLIPVLITKKREELAVSTAFQAILKNLQQPAFRDPFRMTWRQNSMISIGH